VDVHPFLSVEAAGLYTLTGTSNLPLAAPYKSPHPCSSAADITVLWNSRHNSVSFWQVTVVLISGFETAHLETHQVKSSYEFFDMRDFENFVSQYATHLFSSGEEKSSGHSVSSKCLTVRCNFVSYWGILSHSTHCTRHWGSLKLCRKFHRSGEV